MGMANLRSFLRRRFALLALLAEHLAPPVIAVPRLRNSFRYWLYRADGTTELLHKIKLIWPFNYQITNLPNYQIYPPHPPWPRLGFQRSYSIRPQKFRLKPPSNRVKLPSNRIKSASFCSNGRPVCWFSFWVAKGQEPRAKSRYHTTFSSPPYQSRKRTMYQPKVMWHSRPRLCLRKASRTTLNEAPLGATTS